MRAWTAGVAGFFEAPGDPTRVTAVVVTLDEPLERTDVAPLCARLHALLTGRGMAAAVCVVDVYAEPDIVTVEALMRMQLTVRRLTAEVGIRHVPPRLPELLALTGLDMVIAYLPSYPGRC